MPKVTEELPKIQEKESELDTLIAEATTNPKPNENPDPKEQETEPLIKEGVGSQEEATDLASKGLAFKKSLEGLQSHKSKAKSDAIAEPGALSEDQQNKPEDKQEIVPTEPPKAEKIAISTMKKNIPSSLFIIVIIFLLLGGITFAGWIYYTMNYQTAFKLELDSPTGGQITQTPASLILELQQPDDNIVVFESGLIISGKTAPRLPVIISNQSQDIVINAKDDGSFSTVFNLDEGINNVHINIFDENGDQKSVEKSIYYSAEKL